MLQQCVLVCSQEEGSLDAGVEVPSKRSKVITSLTALLLNFEHLDIILMFENKLRVTFKKCNCNFVRVLIFGGRYKWGKWKQSHKHTVSSIRIYFVWLLICGKVVFNLREQH